jgi:hypothetical protein
MLQEKRIEVDSGLDSTQEERVDVENGICSFQKERIEVGIGLATIIFEVDHDLENRKAESFLEIKIEVARRQPWRNNRGVIGYLGFTVEVRIEVEYYLGSIL